MSTAYSSAKQKYIGNGVTTEWGFDFPIQKHSELKVYLKRSSLPQVLLEEGVDYSFVTENTIAFPIKAGEAKLQATDVLALQRESVFESEYNFSNQQRLEPEEVMHADDNLERQIQELKRDSESAIKVQPTSNINTDEYFIAVESIYENLDNINNVSEHSSDIITCSDNISDISTVSSNIDNVNAVGQSISNVNTVATNISDVNTAALNIEAIKDAPNQANSASQSASDASQSATNAANSATASANSAAASAASAQQAAISAAGAHFKLFQHQWFDYELNNDMAWLRADTFSWQDGTVYSNAYNHLVDDVEGKTAKSETINGITIYYWLADDGHKIVGTVGGDQWEQNLIDLYNTTGVAWYYLLDTVHNRFKLPRTKYDFNGLRGNVGDYIPESLPNITGELGINVGDNTTGAFGFIRNAFGYTVSANNNDYRTTFNASRSSSTYQDNAPVQQRGTQQYLYFYVGQYTQSAIEQTAGLNAELFNNKIDIDGNNVITAGANKILNTSSYTTNRILEIPQDIKWRTDLVETGKKRYRLTILKGSVYYVPQGFEADGVTRKFSKRTMIADNTCADVFWSDNASFEEFVFLIFKDNEAILTSSARAGSNITSGDTAPTTFLEQRALWYDTKNNYVKFTNDSGATWHNCSLPLLKGSPRNTIDETHPIAGWVNGPTQVFNGFGYIGSTIFALPGVKCLVGNGRNPDGSCRTKIEESTKVSTFTMEGVRKNNKIVLFRGSVSARQSLFFDEQVNMCYNTGASAHQPTAILGTFSTEATSPWNIKEFNPLGVDSLANSNASNFSKAGESYLSGLGMPSGKYIDLTLGAKGSTYTAPANGWFYFLGKWTNADSYFQMRNITISSLQPRIQTMSVIASGYRGLYMPVRAGDNILIDYHIAPTNVAFAFIYAQGAQ